MKQTKKIGIVGFGNMGQAIAQKLKLDYEIYVFDKDQNKTSNTSGVIICHGIEDVLSTADLIILAVKPQDFSILLDTIKAFGRSKLVISIAAGISTSFIENRLDAGARVVRVMPNMPAKIGQGMSCLCKGKSAKEEDIEIAEKVFKHLGKAMILDEEMMYAATAISGSGPGYLCEFIELNGSDPLKIEKFKADLEEAAKDIGFSRDAAVELVETTTSGTLKMLKRGDLTPSQLKEQVTSKGGTTEAGLKEWHKKGSLADAVKAAWQRAKELSK